MEKQSKKQSLLDRLNNGMKAVDLPPGTLVQVKPNGKSPFLERTSDILRTRHIYPEVFPLRTVEVEKDAYLLYLGIESLGPRATAREREFEISLDTIFVHQFYYGEKTVYLEIGRPDRYYTVFRKHFTRVDNKNNLCR